eukprot:830674-Prymnesium_polylepis.1
MLREPGGAGEPKAGSVKAEGKRAGRHTTTGSREASNLSIPARASAAKLGRDACSHAPNRERWRPR